MNTITRLNNLSNKLKNKIKIQSVKKIIAKYPSPYKLHIGCGSVRLEGWINIDNNNESQVVDIVWDILYGFPFLDNSSCSLIYNEHFLEHLSIDQAIIFLKGCYRILKPNGTLRIAMPSLEYTVDKYKSENWQDQDWLKWEGHEFIKTRAEMINISFRWWGHQWLYDREELHRRLKEAGFTILKDVEWGISEIPEFNNLETRKDSKLICEAVKRLEIMIDLYLGGDIGLWALEQFPANRINQVFTFDKLIFEKAQSLNINVYNQNPNLVEYANSINAISVHYPKIFESFVISKYKKIYNLHPSYLPWGRGYYPIFWALWEDTPAGATLHEINKGIDKGNIVSQIQVEYSEIDTGNSLFVRVRQAEKQLLLEYFGKIADEIYLPSLPQRGSGTYHSKQDFLRLKATDNWQTMEGKELIKLIRCLTFDGYSGLEILVGQRRFEISLRLL